MPARARGGARRTINPPDLPPAPGWSHAVAAGGWIFGGGLMAVEYPQGLHPQARNMDLPWQREALGREADIILHQLATVLSCAGSDMRRDLLRVWQWIVADYPGDADYAAGRMSWPAFPEGTPYARALAEAVGDPLRSSTGIGVRQLPVPGAMMSLDFLALDGTAGQRKEAVSLPPDLPQPKIGYSPVTLCGDWVFLAGFGATDFKGDWGQALNLGPPSMIVPEARVNPYIWLGSEIEAQTEYTLRILSRLAEAAGTSLGRCIKADVTIAHPSDFAGMDRVWRRYFADAPPARNVITGSRLVIKGLRVEIALLLVRGDADIPIDRMDIDDELLVPGHASHAVHAGDFLFTSSLLPLGPDGRVASSMSWRKDIPHFRNPGEEQAYWLAGRLDRLCRAAGASLEGVCKVQAFLRDMAHLPGMLSAWRSSFTQDAPALSAVAMGGGDCLMAPGAVMQWDAIVYAPRLRRKR